MFSEPEASNAQYEEEAQRLRDHLSTVMLAGKAIEEKRHTLVQELAESKVNLIGCNDCGRFENIIENGFQQLSEKSAVIGHLENHCAQLQQGLESSQRGLQTRPGQARSSCFSRELVRPRRHPRGTDRPHGAAAAPARGQRDPNHR